MPETFHAGPNLGRLSDVTIIHGDCIEAMRELADDSIDAIVTDPPYGLSNTDTKHVVEALTHWLAGDRSFVPHVGGGGFMGKDWDKFVPPPAAWDECFRVLKPGGALLSFAGTRTIGLMEMSIRLAGFDIWDSVAWMHGQGFPKGKTQLKPAFEPVICTRKPLKSLPVNVLEMVESGLRERGIQGDIRWTKEPVNGAEKPGPQTSSSLTHRQPAAETSADHAAALVTPSAAPQTGNSCETDTQPGDALTLSTSGSTAASETSRFETTFSTPTVESAHVAASPATPSSPLTTSVAEARSTDLRPGARSMQTFDDEDSPRAIESFAGIATGLTGQWTTVRISRKHDGSFIWPTGLPRQVKAKSLSVAANVLAHGTGALNIDATRIAATDKAKFPAGVVSDTEAVYGNGEGRYANRPRGVDSDPSGRWPANVCLDSSQAAALDEQSGTAKPKPERVGRRGGVNANPMSWTESNGDLEGRWPADPGGGASRFFYCAKAPKKERPVYVDADGKQQSHATVKPLALMRWLVRLVTPPGGIVLDPFAGSGTTVEAALQEGFRVIGIERETDYLPMIQQRIARTVS